MVVGLRRGCKEEKCRRLKSKRFFFHPGLGDPEWLVLETDGNCDSVVFQCLTSRYQRQRSAISIIWNVCLLYGKVFFFAHCLRTFVYFCCDFVQLAGHVLRLL